MRAVIDALGSFLVRAIVFDIDRCRGPILLADSMHSCWIAICLSEARIRPAPGFENRNHVEDGKTLQALRMIERDTVGDASSAIMADQREGR
jgi:hypothetical protein